MFQMCVLLLVSAVFPEAGERGISREEFTSSLSGLLQFLSLQWPDDVDVKNVEEALKFQYTHWADPMDPFEIRTQYIKVRLNEIGLDFNYDIMIINWILI